MRRLLVLLLAVSCSQSPPRMVIPAPPPAQAIDAAVVATPADAAPVAIADAGPPPPKYRTEASTWNVDPSLVATGKTYMVATEDAYATQAGIDVLAAGGNAVDAAVATAFTLAVTHPSAGNLAGGGFAVIRTGKGKVDAIDFRETAPAAATADMYKEDPKSSLAGFKASGVPGSVAGLEALHKKYGKKKWKDLIAPAIAYARDGYKVPETLHMSLARGYIQAPMRGALADMLMPNGKPVETGDIVKNPELAIVLERIANKGSAGFYKGETAKAIADAMKAGGGLITDKDLAGYKAIWRTPIQVTYRGKRLYTMPPPSSGGVVIAMTANMLRNTDVGKLGWHTAMHVHWLAEVWRRAFAARNEALGDPAFVKNPVAKLTSQIEADRLAATITDRATPSKDVPALIEGKHTTNFSIVDGKGMAVALTTTLNTGFGSGVMISGVIMNNEMDDFMTQPGKPNTFGLIQGEANKIEPGKRMLSSMSPTIVEDEAGELYMVVGAEGGPRIITAVFQTISNVIDFGMPVEAAIAAPRVHQQHLPDSVAIEDEAMTKQATDELHALGYELVQGERARMFGAANAIVRTKTGWAGASDPRTGGGASGDR